jgi:hypothetical protein
MGGIRVGDRHFGPFVTRSTRICNLGRARWSRNGDIRCEPNTTYRMNLPPIRCLWAAGILFGAAPLASAQDNAALINALIQKGILTQAEAQQIQQEVKQATPVVSVPGSRNVTRLSLTGRIQAQYETFSTDADHTGDPVSTNAFNIRRLRLGARADFGKDFAGIVSYDFASNNLDVGYVRWTQSPDLTLDAGFRKVTFGFEENTSSAALKAIERSPTTRFFVEGNNGRRLGAGSRRTGIFADGKSGDFFFGAAVTNSNRQDNPSRQSAGNDLALWANAGLRGKAGDTAYTLGASIGWLPEQRQNTGALVSADELLVTSLYGNVAAGKAGLTAELLWSDNARGPGYHSWGFYLQPTYSVTKAFELVGRYSYLDTDGLGTSISDVLPGVANPATAANFDRVSEFYFGGNHYFRGNDVKFSAGLLYALFDEQVGGAGIIKASTIGLRTQMQVNF